MEDMSWSILHGLLILSLMKQLLKKEKSKVKALFWILRFSGVFMPLL